MRSHTGCGCMTNRTGTLIFGWLEVMGIVPMMFAGLVAVFLGFTGVPGECPSIGATKYTMESIMNSADFYVNNNCYSPENRQYFLIGGIVALAVGSLCLLAPCCLIRGVNNKRPSLMIPYIILGVLNKIGLFVIIIVCCITTLPAVVLPILLFAFEMWKTVVVCSHYNYLSKKPEDGDEMLLNKEAYVHI